MEIDVTHDLLPVKSDFVFKRIFGDQRNTDILAGFLKSVLDIPEEEYERITIVDPHVKKEFEDDKYGILDVKLRTKNQNVVHIEIQVEPIHGMVERIIYDQAKMITEQIQSGENWTVINRVVTIVITDYPFILGSPKYHHQFRWREKDGFEFTGINEIDTLELRKLPREDNNTDLWDWMKFIKSDDREAMEMLAEKNPQIKKAIGLLQVLSADERTRMLYEEREIARRDMRSNMDGARNEGRQEGVVAVARNSIIAGLDTDTIIKITGLTKKEIDALRQN